MTETYWKPKTRKQFAEDKKKVFKGDLILYLLTGIENEEVDRTKLIRLMSRAHNFTDSRCRRAGYRIVSHTGDRIGEIPGEGVLFKLEKFPIDALVEIEFENRLFTRDSADHPLVPWDYKWTGPSPTPTPSDTFTILLYPGQSHHPMKVSGMTTVHLLIKPVIKSPQAIATAIPVSEGPTIEVELTLTESKEIHIKRVEDLKRELSTYDDFIQRWENIDKHSLAEQKKALKYFDSKLSAFQKESSSTLEVGKELKDQMESRMAYIKDEIAILSGQEIRKERLVCIPADNEAYHGLLLEYPLQVLRHIRFLPLYFDNRKNNKDIATHGRQYYLLRFDPEQSFNPVTERFLVELKNILGKSFIGFWLDRRWALMGINIWLPEAYTLKPFFFNYREDEKTMAQDHIREMARSVWGEGSREYKAIDRTMSGAPPRPGPDVSPSPPAPGTEIIFIPRMQEEPGSKKWMSPGIAIIEGSRFKSLVDNMKFLNAGQSAVNNNYFTELYRKGLDHAVMEFKSKYLALGQAAALKKKPQLKELLDKDWTGLLNENIQQDLFSIFKNSVLKEAEAIINEKTGETIEAVEKRLERLQRERERRLAEAESAQRSLERSYREWNEYYDKIRSAIDRYREKARNAREIYKGKWKAARRRWNSLILKTREMAGLEAQFRKTEYEFSKLLGKLFLHVSVGVVTIVIILIIVYMLIGGGQT